MCEILSLCHGHYLGIIVILGIASMAFLSAKAGLYNTFDTRIGISPMVAVEGQHHLGFPLLLISSCVFALVHIVVQGMELELRQLEEAAGSIHKEMLYLRDK